MKRRILSLLIAALAGCGGSDEGGAALRVSGCEAVDAAPCDVLVPECRSRLFDLASCLREQPGAALPPVTVMTPAEYGDHLRGLIDDEPPPVTNHVETALAMLQLVRPGALDTAAVIARRVESVLGTYFSETGSIVLVDRGAAGNATQSSATLVHEFAHALQDQAFGLPALYDAHATSSDAGLVLSALIEGEATWLEDRYSAALLGIDTSEFDWRQRYSERVALSEERSLEEASPYAVSTSLFSYSWGARYVNLLHEAGGPDAVAAAFGAPPLGSHALMASEDAAVTEDPTPVEPPAPTAPAEWTAIDDDVLGAWGTFLVLSRLTQAPALAPALAWRGDRLWVYGGASVAGAAETAFVWKLELADEPSATRAASLLSALAPGGHARQIGASVVLARASLGGDVEWAFTP